MPRESMPALTQASLPTMVLDTLYSSLGFTLDSLATVDLDWTCPAKRETGIYERMRETLALAFNASCHHLT
jgi:hypothetical protein